MNRYDEQPPRWMGPVLIAAGIYNLVWGSWAVLFPAAIFAWSGAEPPRYPEIWQCVGMIVGVYGIGYLIAARDPVRHWPIVLVGLLGKILGPAGFLLAAWDGRLPWAWGMTIITNDLLWWYPFAATLYWAFRVHSAPRSSDVPPLPELMQTERSHRGATLAELSHRHATLVVFLRHAGCTFCREVLSDLARQRHQIESNGTRLAIVHMSSPMTATQLCERFGLGDVHRFADPDCRLYRAFGLERGRLGQLFAPRIVIRGAQRAFLDGLGLGMLDGDGFRMPGAFLIRNGKMIRAYRAETAGDRPDYAALACDLEPAPAYSTTSPSQLASLGGTGG